MIKIFLPEEKFCAFGQARVGVEFQCPLQSFVLGALHAKETLTFNGKLLLNHDISFEDTHPL